MSTFLIYILCAIALLGPVATAPAGSISYSVASGGAGTAVSSATEPSETAPLASNNPNGITWSVTADADPQPIRGSLGATILGPQNVELDKQNPDLLAPPTTDAGDMYVTVLCLVGVVLNEY